MSETLSLVITVGSALLALASAGFSCFTYFKNIRHDRRRDTLEAYNRLQNEVFDKLNQMLSFTIWTIVESITIWATGYVDVFIVSSFLSSHYLGLYRTSMTTVNSIMALVVAATTPVLFSSLSRLQDFPEEYSKMFFKYQKYVSIILIPLGTAIYIFNEFVYSFEFFSNN